MGLLSMYRHRIPLLLDYSGHVNRIKSYSNHQNFHRPKADRLLSGPIYLVTHSAYCLYRTLMTTKWFEFF